MRIKFQQSLDELKERLLVMAGLVEQAIQRSIEAYSTRDIGLIDLVLRSEPAINRMEREIDHQALDLLAMEQPMAVDLRFILAVIRINADLERVGDQAVSIASRVQQMGMFANGEIPVDIPELAALAAAMVRKALQAFIEGDADLAQSVLALDDEVDQKNRDAFRSLSTLIVERPEMAPQALHALIISRNLERVGDHATNIAEDVIFWVRGADVRHGGMINDNNPTVIR
jgi:phosphate transport system protein